jgi:HAD superfamily hydrolase (TIGR01484 family)
LLAVTDSCDQLLADLKQNFKRLNIIRATSPLDKKAIWIEVFPEKVSKGHAAEWLSELLAIDPAFCMSVGNDYNDLAMLEWTRHSYIMQNAALELQKQFFCVPDNNSNGFSFAINHWLKELGL